MAHPTPTPAHPALTAAHTSYTTANPSSHTAHTHSLAHLPGGNTRTVLHTSPFPLTFSSASSCTLTSLDGTTYTDFLGEFTAGIYGHNDPTIRAAIDAALDRGWSYGGTNLWEKELAALLCERFKPTVELVRFCNSGTEANMMAVAAAVAWSGQRRRRKVLVFEKGYHGATLSFRGGTTATATATAAGGGKGGDGGGKRDVNLPHEWVVAPYNDVEATREVLAGIPKDSLAAVLVEPMLGSGGGIPGSKAFLQFLRDYATEHGALLIFDEVMTSRLGYRGLGYEIGIRPDLMTLGKWVGGGMSFGAFGGRKDIMDMFDPRGGSLAHAGTFNNNVISMAAGVAGCKLLNEDRIGEVNALGEDMKAMMQDVMDRHLGEQKANGLAQTNGDDGTQGALETPAKPFMEDLSNGHSLRPTVSTSSKPASPSMWISGLGSISVIHFATSPVQSTLQSLFFHYMLTQNIYLGERGFIALSKEITREHVDAFVDATQRFIVQYKEMILGADK